MSGCLTELDNIYRNSKILKLDEVIDLDLKKIGYKVYNNLLPSKLLYEIKTDFKGCTLVKGH